MKPRTKLQKEVAELSEKLGEISESPKNWAKEHLFARTAYKCKDELWCSECGKMWINTDNSELGTILLGNKTECPYCHHKLDVTVSRKSQNKEEIYMDILQVVGNFQVIRHVLCCKYSCKSGFREHPISNPYYSFFETVQEWIAVNGKRAIIARPMNMGGNGWLYSEPLSIKNEYGSGYYSYGDVYSIHGWLYSKIELLPELKKRGIGRNFPDVNPSRLIRSLLTGNNDAELCLKTKQMAMLKHMAKEGYYQLRYKPSFNICNRNHYIIRDVGMWNDYIDLLLYFKKDVRNAKYVCPKNLKAEHDLLMNKKRSIEAKLRRDRERREAIRREKERRENIIQFYKRMEKFFGLEITDGSITIRPLESITQFYQEGKAMHHCVYTNGYYKRNDCLILSARIGEKRIETIELSLKTLEVVQSRGACNQNTEYHKRIIGLVKKNIGLIRNRLSA